MEFQNMPMESPMSTPNASPRQPLVCPPAPMKPSIRDPSCRGAARAGMEAAREAIRDLSEEQRAQVLPLIPRHSVEPLFVAYCNFQTSESPSHSDDTFLEVAALVPDLDLQLFQQAAGAFPGLSWEAWMEWVQVASEDHAFCEQVATGLMQSLSETIRKNLMFA